MINREFTHNGYTFKRVNKKTARKLYKNGLTILINPCNLHPFSMWTTAYQLNRNSREQFVIDEIGIENDFNSWINSFEYYNCTNSETGKYASYYIPIKYVDPFTGTECDRDYYQAIEQYDYSFIN